MTDALSKLRELLTKMGEQAVMSITKDLGHQQVIRTR